MSQVLDHPSCLRLVEDRAAALRAAVAQAADLSVQVPTCPEWSLRDLVEHVGGSHRRWAATVAAGPAEAPPDPAVWTVAPGDDLLAWSAASTQLLLGALDEAGPDRGCWTWWAGSGSPQTSGAVARHQVQHVTVHAFDAQTTVGAPQPLPDDAARDGVDEFLSTCVTGPYAWPHGACTVGYDAVEGGSWRVALTPDGVGPAPRGASTRAVLRGTSSDLVLAFYGRQPLGELQVEGDGTVYDQLLAWEPG